MALTDDVGGGGIYALDHFPHCPKLNGLEKWSISPDHFPGRMVNFPRLKWSISCLKWTIFPWKMDHFSQAGFQLGRGVDRSTLWAGRGVVLDKDWNEEWLGNVVGTVGDAYLGRDKLLSVLCGMRAHARTDHVF